jgi:hypothetical protein
MKKIIRSSNIFFVELVSINLVYGNHRTAIEDRENMTVTHTKYMFSS